MSSLAAKIAGKTREEIREEMLRLLSGEGIEVGALNNAAVVQHLKVHYVDRLTREQALTHYPELQGHALAAVGIIDDAETLATIPDRTQDFVIANHVIEHMANPIQALLTWGRVLKLGGRLFLAVPDKRCTFDRERELTPYEHLIEDFRAPSAGRDFEHFRDFVRLVSCRVYHARPEDQAEDFARELWEMKYSIHYHVWDYDSFSEFIALLQRDFPEWPMRTIESVPTQGHEFIYVFERV